MEKENVRRNAISYSNEEKAEMLNQLQVPVKKSKIEDPKEAINCENKQKTKVVEQQESLLVEKRQETKPKSSRSDTSIPS